MKNKYRKYKMNVKECWLIYLVILGETEQENKSNHEKNEQLFDKSLNEKTVN